MRKVIASELVSLDGVMEDPSWRWRRCPDLRVGGR
jgi:hypothetical protein